MLYVARLSVSIRTPKSRPLIPPAIHSLARAFFADDERCVCRRAHVAEQGLASALNCDDLESSFDGSERTRPVDVDGVTMTY